MIRRKLKIRPLLTLAFVLFWTFHFSFGMFTHYHPEYVHAHDGELQAHSHGGHFHSLELDSLAHFIEADHQHELPGETHHHSESLPGSDNKSVQYDFNKSGVTKVVQLALDFHPTATAIDFTPVDLQNSHTLQIASDTNRTLLCPRNHPERSPPLRV